jgi:hypothetical protein
MQRLGCDCKGRALRRCRTTWTGRWPGEAECADWGWWARLQHGRWVPCTAGESDAVPDLNRLYAQTRWDRLHQRYVRLDDGS